MMDYFPFEDGILLLSIIFELDSSVSQMKISHRIVFNSSTAVPSPHQTLPSMRIAAVLLA